MSAPINTPNHDDDAHSRTSLLRPGHPDFAVAVSLLREAREACGVPAMLALWRDLGLPWVDEMEVQRRPRTASGQDAVSLFAAEGLDKVQGALLPARFLWPAFMAFCRTRQLPCASVGSFYTRFGRLGYDRQRVRGRVVYLNLRPRIPMGDLQKGNGYPETMSLF